MLDLPIDMFHDQNNSQTPPSNYIHLVSLKPSILAAMIKIPKKDPQQTYKSYADLPCPEEDKAKIYDLISTMGENGKITLLLKHKSRLEKIGDEIRYIYPLKFLGFVFSQPQLKVCMQAVLDDYFKRTNFIDGLTPRIETETIKGTIDLYLDDFAREVNADVSILKTYINKKDWRGFLEYLSQL